MGIIVLLLWLLHLHLHLLSSSGVAARPLKVVCEFETRNSIVGIAGMKHSGPSPGGKGHHRPRILAQLKDSGPSPGVGH